MPQGRASPPCPGQGPRSGECSLSDAAWVQPAAVPPPAPPTVPPVPLDLSPVPPRGAAASPPPLQAGEVWERGAWHHAPLPPGAPPPPPSLPEGPRMSSMSSLGCNPPDQPGFTSRGTAHFTATGSPRAHQYQTQLVLCGLFPHRTHRHRRRHRHTGGAPQQPECYAPGKPGGGHRVRTGSPVRSLC